MKAFVSDTGQISVPPKLWHEMHVEVGQQVNWEQISPTEYRITLLPPEKKVTPDPMAALGFAREYGLEEGTTAEWMKLVRGDDCEE